MRSWKQVCADPGRGARGHRPGARDQHAIYRTAEAVDRDAPGQV